MTPLACFYCFSYNRFSFEHGPFVGPLLVITQLLVARKHREMESIKINPSEEFTLNHPQIKAMNNLHLKQEKKKHCVETKPLRDVFVLTEILPSGRRMNKSWQWKNEKERERREGEDARKWGRASVWAAHGASWPTVGRSGCWALCCSPTVPRHRGDS